MSREEARTSTSASARGHRIAAASTSPPAAAAGAAVANAVPAAPMLEGDAAMFAPAFVGRWQPVYRSPAYRASLLAAAMFMVLVPVLYLAVLGLIGWATYWHFSTNTHLVSLERSGRVGVWQVVVYVTPGLIGLVLILMLLQPVSLLFRKGPDDDPVEIYPSEEPRLFAFVNSVCETMGAPKPKRIFVDCNVNAAASLKPGLIGVFTPNSLGLHIGLPLVAGLNATAFASILAHEFGHFSQGAGMRATALVHRTSHWLYTAAFSHGKADALVAKIGNTGEGLLVVVAFALSICMFIARLVLRAVFFVGFFIAQLMSRRMEYDADAHAARFSGSGICEKVWEQVGALDYAAHEAEVKVAERWSKRALPEDLPGLIASLARRLSPDAKIRIRKQLDKPESGWLDSHPATVKRVKAVKALDEPGVFKLDEPASRLFTNFGAISKKASFNHYKARVGEMIFSATFVPANEIFGSQAKEDAKLEQSRSMLGFEPPNWRPLRIEMTELIPAADPKRTWETIKANALKLKEAGPAAMKVLPDFLAAETAEVEAAAATGLFELGVKSLHAEMGFTHTSRPAIERAREVGREKGPQAAWAIDEALDAAAARVGGCLRLLAVKGIERKLPEAEQMRERARVLLAAHHTLAHVMPTMQSMRGELAQISALAVYMNLEPKQRDAIMKKARPLSDSLRERVLNAREQLGGTMSPFPGPDGGMPNLGELIIRATPAWREYDQILGAANDSLSRYVETVRLVADDLAAVAMKVEDAVRPAAAK
jgi:Zn-dependent protease with chaperone function